MYADRIKKRIAHYQEQEKQYVSVQDKRDARLIIIGLQEALHITMDTPSKYFRAMEQDIMRSAGGGRYYKVKDGHTIDDDSRGVADSNNSSNNNSC